MNMIVIPQSVISVLTQLETNGYQAYLVGGCVRDICIGIIPHDWDIATSALPEEIMRIFPKTYAQGVKYGTVGVIENDMVIEATTFRVESNYRDYRHPTEVEFVSELYEDLSRRDFTINALAYESDGTINDFFNGIEDIKNGTIKTVGDPIKRFSEDPLRMLRAVRFAAQLGFEIDPDTLEGINKCAHLCTYLSHERISKEIEKILLSSNPSKLGLFISSSIYTYIFPQGWVSELSKADLRKLSGLLALISNFPSEFSIRLGLFTAITDYITNTDSSEEFVNGLKTSNEVANKALSISSAFKENIEPVRQVFARIIKLFGIESMQTALKLQSLIYHYYNDIRFINAENTIALLEKEIKNGGLEIKDLAIKGRDLLKLGLRGQEIGNTLIKLHDMVIADPRINNYPDLLAKATEVKNNDENGH